MLVFPNSKINLGLNIVEKRPDGFHNIETVFYPLNWCDALEVIENQNQETSFNLSLSGLPVAGDLKQNLLYKTWQLVSHKKKLPPLNVHLHKHIPMGAGLGGGSADAAFFIKTLNKKFKLNFSEEQQVRIASELGSDCAFFINNRPTMATGSGNIFSDVKLDLSSYYIAVVFPAIHSNTREAYQGVVPKPAAYNLKRVIEQEPVNNWKHILVNDFEVSIFKKYPAIQRLKAALYTQGAIYAALSGSGSAVFGIFDHEPAIKLEPGYHYCLQKPASSVL